MSANGWTVAAEPRHILRLLASGVVEVASRASRHQLGDPSSAYPYPVTLERALNLICQTAFQLRAPMPESVPDLLAWCRERPLKNWPIDVPNELAGADELLIEEGVPTAACLELALPVRGDWAEADLFERTFIDQLLSQSQALGRPELYSEVRRLMVERPVLDAYDREALRLNLALQPAWPLIDVAYPPAPLEAAAAGRRYVCRECGNLLVQHRRGRLICVDTRCSLRLRDATLGQPLNDHGACYWLRFDLRAFISAPGRAELDLARRIRSAGARTELWPEYDAYDIAVELPSGERWAVDVKDWTNPFRLAAAMKPFPTEPAWDRGFFVVPDDRATAYRGYLNAVRFNCGSGVLGERIELVTSRQFVARVRRGG